MTTFDKPYGHDRIVKQMSKALDEAIDKVELTEALCNWTDMLNDLSRIRGELTSLRRKYPNEFK